MLSRSDSWGRSTDDVQSAGSGAMGAVLERPTWARRVGVTSDESGESGEAEWQAPWPGSQGVLDLTEAGGEVFVWASKSGDMGSTLVRP
jgi:hypothetical protein